MLSPLDAASFLRSRPSCDISKLQYSPFQLSQRHYDKLCKLSNSLFPPYSSLNPSLTPEKAFTPPTKLFASP